MPILKNVPVQWASVINPSTQFEHQWEIQVELTKDQADQLKEEGKALHKKGIKIKEENGKLFFRFRRKVKKPDGTDNPAPVVIGPDGQPFDKLIGNGSICNVQYSLVAYKHAKFGEGVTNDLKGIRVIEHVPYGERDGDGLMDDDDSSGPKKSSHHSSNEYDDDDDL